MHVITTSGLYTPSTPDQHRANSRRERIQSMAVIAWDGQRFREPVRARLYMSKSRDASKVYASLWVGGNLERHAAGHAGGYGYHKASAALDAAISNAGIGLSESINGRGESAMREALLTIGRAAMPDIPAGQMTIVEL